MKSSAGSSHSRQSRPEQKGDRSGNFNKDGSYNRRTHSSTYQRRQYSEGEKHIQDSVFSTFENDSSSAVVRESINERPDTSLYGRIEIKKNTDSE